MPVIRILQWLAGWLLIEAEGGFRGIYLNSLTESGAMIWNVCSYGGKVCHKIRISDLHLVRKAAAAAGMKIHIPKKRGMPFLLNRYRGRWGIIAGLIFFIGGLYFLSGYVWVVNYDIRDTEVPRETLTATLEGMGLKIGAPIDSLDFYMMQNDCILELPSLKWIGISREGATVTVRTRDRISSPELLDGDVPCNIKANRDAQIISVMPYEGETAVRAGDTVLRGETIVSGARLMADGKYRFFHARADIRARTYYETELFVPEEACEFIFTGETKRNKSLFFFGKTINFSVNSGNPEPIYDIIYSSNYITLFSCRLPIGTVETVYEEKTADIHLRNEQEMELAVESAVSEYESEDLKDKSIISREKEVIPEDGGCRVKLKYYCEEDIGYSEEITDFSIYENPIEEGKNKEN